jgi:NTF2-related export protein 1/2
LLSAARYEYFQPSDLLTHPAAENFTDAYYTALQSSRNTISSYYVPKTELPSGQTIPSIVLNGAVFDDGDAVQKFFINEMLPSGYEVQSLDCHVLNPSLKPLETGRKTELTRNMSLLVSVNGYVRLQEGRSGPMKGFSETFVLVPNEEFTKGKAPRTEKKSWLIQTQNFRYVT